MTYKDSIIVLPDGWNVQGISSSYSWDPGHNDVAESAANVQAWARSRLPIELAKAELR